MPHLKNLLIFVSGILLGGLLVYNILGDFSKEKSGDGITGGQAEAEADLEVSSQDAGQEERIKEDQTRTTAEVNILNASEYQFFIDGIFRDFQGSQIILEYEGEPYFPARFIAALFGENYIFDDNRFEIYGESPVFEPIIHHAYKLTYENLTPQRLIELLGEPEEIREYVNEVNAGNLETVYRFEAGEFQFESPPGGEPFIKAAKLKSPTFETLRGIRVGSTKTEVEKAYGNFLFRSDEMWTAVPDAIGLVFIFQGDLVSEIRYIFLGE